MKRVLSLVCVSILAIGTLLSGCTRTQAGAAIGAGAGAGVGGALGGTTGAVIGGAGGALVGAAAAQ